MGLIPTPERIHQKVSKLLGLELNEHALPDIEFTTRYNRIRRRDKPSPESWEPAVFGESLPRDPLTGKEIPMSASCCRECRTQFDDVRSRLEHMSRVHPEWVK